MYPYGPICDEDCCDVPCMQDDCEPGCCEDNDPLVKANFSMAMGLLSEEIDPADPMAIAINALIKEAIANRGAKTKIPEKKNTVEVTISVTDHLTPFLNEVNTQLEAAKAALDAADKVYEANLEENSTLRQDLSVTKAELQYWKSTTEVQTEKLAEAREEGTQLLDLAQRTRHEGEMLYQALGRIQTRGSFYDVGMATYARANWESFVNKGNI